MAVAHRVAGPRHLGGRESWVQQFITPLPPLPAPARLRPPSTPFSFLSTHNSPFVASCIPTTPAPKHKGTLPSYLCSSHALSLEHPALTLPSQILLLHGAPLPGLTGRGFLPPEKSLTCCHSILLGPDGMLPWRSVCCPPIYLPSLPLKA